jgi:hypothetical protein
MDLADRIAGPNHMEEIMSHISKLSAALATTSIIVLSASAAYATINVPKPVINIPKPIISIPKPAINIPKPVINVAVPKPAVNFVSAPITSLSRPSMFAGRPATVQNTVSNWRGPSGAGMQMTSMIYQNGKLVAATSSISSQPATTAPKPGTMPVANNNNGPIKPGTVQIANHPAPATPAPAASQPAPAKPAAPAAATPAKPKITFTPAQYPAFTVNGAIKGYYVNGKLVMGLTGPSGTACGVGTAFQIPGSSGVSATYSTGAISIPVVRCMNRS